MARRSAAEKRDTHQKILEHAAQTFRAHGTAVGIGEMMKDLGLTHGGFYRHFGSKNDLLIDAVALSLREIADRLDQIARQAEKGRELEAIIKAYLSAEHLLHPETWCVLAALAPDIGRQPAAVKKRLEGAMHYYLERMAPYMPGATRKEQQQNFAILFSAMSGAIAMMRAMGNKEMRDQLLRLTREYYLRTFAGASSPGAS